MRVKSAKIVVCVCVYSKKKFNKFSIERKIIGRISINRLEVKRRRGVIINQNYM